MPFRIETDALLREVLGTDGPAWASAYLKQRRHLDGDMLHIELAAWFDAAVANSVAAERAAVADGLRRIHDDYPMRASDIAAFLAANRFAEFIGIWTSGNPAWFGSNAVNPDWRRSLPAGLEQAITEFKQALPGWWFSIGECQASADASCAPTVESEQIALIPCDARFDAGFHADLPQPASMADALRTVMNEALQAIAAAEAGRS